jgi:hypothetical protein
LALLALFNGSSATVEAAEQASSPGSTSVAAANEASNTVVMGQALCAPAGPQGGALGGAVPPPAVPMGPPLAPTNAVHQLQLQAVMQHQAAIMQNPQAYPVAAQMYQQHFLAAQQQAAAAAAGAPVMLGKRGKSQEEIEEQTERIKKRRRESAQRRCARASPGAGEGSLAQRQAACLLRQRAADACRLTHR